MYGVIETQSQTGKKLGTLLSKYRSITGAAMESLRILADKDDADIKDAYKGLTTVWHVHKDLPVGSPLTFKNKRIRHLTVEEYERLKQLMGDKFDYDKGKS